MTPELPASVSFVARPAPAEQPAAHSPPAPEEVRAIEAVFAQGQPQDTDASGLVAAWAAGILLHDLVRDAQAEPADESDPEPEKPRREP